jgi:flavin reductase (DIM6/NTAB) family NADH-FMN oxidoreductase RutF/DNA-binding MarR family transcriptional regulator
MTGAIDSQRLRQALGAFTTGVTIVTTVDAAGADVGMTANSFNSVSLEPPLVLWSIGRSSTNFAAFLAANHFAVHVLAADQDALATRFAKRGVDRFAGLEIGRGPGGIPLLDGCAARFQCRMAFQHESGDHVILVGEVLELDQLHCEPLVFKGGRYALAVHKAADAGAPPEAAPGAFAPDFLIYQLGRAYYQILQGILPEVQRHGLGLAEYFALSMLGIRDGRSQPELDGLVSYTGVRITAVEIERLAQAGLVDAGGGTVLLTQQGRKLLVELMAAAKAASDQAEDGFDPSEARLLRQFLERLIVSSDPGLPSPWQA